MQEAEMRKALNMLLKNLIASRRRAAASIRSIPPRWRPAPCTASHDWPDKIKPAHAMRRDGPSCRMGKLHAGGNIALGPHKVSRSDVLQVVVQPFCHVHLFLKRLL
jgi:hypothetical protein